MIRRALLTAALGTAVVLVPGTAHAAAYQCTGPSSLLFDNWNGGAVENGGTPPSFDTAGQSYCVNQIATYHWNGGRGKAGGRISLVGGGTTIGPYPAEASGATAPTDWIANVSTPSQPVVINGRYSCRDSDPATWASNSDAGGRGFCRVFAQQAQVVSAGISGSLSVPAPNSVQADLTVGGTQTLTAIRVDLNPAVQHTGAVASVNGGAPSNCGPFQGSNTALVCPGLSAPPGAAVRINVTTNVPYPDNGGADAHGDAGAGFVGPFFLPGPAPAGQPHAQPVASPEAQKTVAAKVVSGAVLVRVPGTTAFVPAGQIQSIPVGSIVDARKGRVQIRARGPDGEIVVAEFFEGQFKVVQILEKGISLITEAELFGGNFKRCPVGQRKAVAPAAKAKSVRHLWAAGSGSFRTRGRFSSASIRGTQWLTDERCDATLTRVTQGSVLVRDFVRRKAVVVKAGKRYLAKAPAPRRRRR
jgi:hypothetical protein